MNSKSQNNKRHKVFRPLNGSWGISFVLLTAFFILSVSGTLAYADDNAQINLQPQALNFAGIYPLQKTEPNLTGEGLSIVQLSRNITYFNETPINDYVIDVKHDCFKNADIGFHDEGSWPQAVSEHSTAIGSILIGDDPNGYFEDIGKFHYRGALPDADLDVYEFWYFITEHVFTGQAPDCDLITMSFGTQFGEWWTRGMQSLSERTGVLITAGIGNGSDVYDPPLYPAAGANVLAVGVVDCVKSQDISNTLSQFALPNEKHSSIGPTYEGRCKPDIVAPANCLVADSNSSGYRVSGNWSSFSTPIAAATAGLLIQKAKSDPNLEAALSEQMGNCVLKAILMNSATKLPYWHKGEMTKDDDHYWPLDFSQGAGVINALKAYDNLVAGMLKPGSAAMMGWDNNRLNEDSPINEYYIDTPKDKNGFINATLTWNMHYQDKYPFDLLEEKNSDLRLELWAIDPNDPAKQKLIDYSDSSMDNVEHIHFPVDANYSHYKIVVKFSDLAGSSATGQEKYAIAMGLFEKDPDSTIYQYDLNHDGVVNTIDFTILLNNISKVPHDGQFYIPGDINMDGQIDFDDLQILAQNRQKKASWVK